MRLPGSFIRKIIAVHSRNGKSWLKNLPALIQYCEEKYSLNVSAPFSLSYNFVAPAVFKDGSEAVLKLCVPSEEVHGEIDALRLYNGKGMVELIEADKDRGILILERLKTGHTLQLNMMRERRWLLLV